MATKEDKEVLAQEAQAEREYQRTKDKDAKDAKDDKPAYRTDAPEVTPTLTVPESGAELREYIYRLQTRLSKGSKSDIDKIVPVLGVILGWLDAHLANQVPDPPVMGDPLDATY